MAKALALAAAVAAAALAGSPLAHADTWPWDDPRDGPFVEAVGSALGLDRVNGTKVAKTTVCDELAHGWPAADVVHQVARTLELTGEQARVFANLAVQVYCPDWQAVAPPPSQAPPAPAPRGHQPVPQEPDSVDVPWGSEEMV